jgi:lysophospholipase L1-like esterase
LIAHLPRIGRLVASGKPIKIVALGSSSTYGAGASTSATSYPSRLAEELARHFPGHEITVLNRGGNNGDDVAAMLARLDSAVIAEKPDLVLWQLGTNSLLRDEALPPHASLVREGFDHLDRRWAALHTAPSIPGRSNKPWARARRASLALLPQRPRQDERRTGGAGAFPNMWNPFRGEKSPVGPAKRGPRRRSR